VANNAIADVPEVAALDRAGGMIRIPPELDVPLTPRVRRLIDTASFRRLARISQLGLVALVYPAANHSRFEHSLGVYRMALLYLRHLAQDRRFAAAIGTADAELLIAAALLHDLGHWPFCHPIEDIHLPEVPTHEQFAGRLLRDTALAEVLRQSWSLDPRDVTNLLSGEPAGPQQRILDSILSGPIDIDKMDYLARDSLHAGVPYGNHFDRPRLIGSLCLNESGDGLAVTSKGKTAAEMMVFARYVMFSEVYWHHAVRSATAMFQRAFYLLHRQIDLAAMFLLTEEAMISRLMEQAAGQPAGELLDGLFGIERRLYKRVDQFSLFEQPEIYGQLARRPYPDLVRCSELFAALCNRSLPLELAPHEVLFDAPPVHREVEFKLQVFDPKANCYRRLGDISPVCRVLAQEQFDDYVKRVRIFAHPRVAESLRQWRGLPEAVSQAARQLR